MRHLTLPVHLDLVRRLVDERRVTRLLDAGCGPASMLRHLLAPGRAAYGFDLLRKWWPRARACLQSVVYRSRISGAAASSRRRTTLCRPSNARTTTALSVAVYCHIFQKLRMQR